MTVTGISGTQYQLDSTLLSDGGEGKIYRVLGSTPKKVAKIYKTGISTRELEEKLTIMVNRPPNSKVLSQVAWPLDVVYDTNKRFCGFIMPELNINAELGEIYKYPSQINISSLQKIIIAENICVVISEVHKAGYVFGDFNPRNIGVDKNNCTVAFLDTDTYHVVDSSQKKVFRCNVCAPGYSAPELLEKCANHVSANPSDKSQVYAKTPLPTFTNETDNFALAVHIFKLLMNGYTPYGGIIDTASASQASPGTGDAAVKRDNYCFKPGFKHQSVAIPSLDTFPQEISDLFTRAFILGKIDPKQRPSAVEWHKALEKYEKTLVTCTANPLHQYAKSNFTCPLCEADQRFDNAMSPQIMQKPYSGTAPPPVQVPKKSTPPPSLGSQVRTKSHISIISKYNSSTKPSSTSKNWWQRLSKSGKTAVVIVSLGVLALGFGVFNGWYGRNNNVPTTRSVPEGFVRIPAGTFTMGSPENEPGRHRNEGPQRQVTLSSFYMGKNQVTVGEFRRFVNATGYRTSAETSTVLNLTINDQIGPNNWRNPDINQDENHPVVMITWLDALEYCNWLSAQEGLTPVYRIHPYRTQVTWSRNANGYRLPTEAEWEFASRAGTTTAFSTGSSISTSQANFNNDSTMPVGSFAANPWGLHDMHGNVWEWCWDREWDYPRRAQTNPRGQNQSYPTGGSVLRIIRGGSWNHSDHTLRSARRAGINRHSRENWLGFRLVRSVE